MTAIKSPATIETTYKITHSHGETETGIDTYEEALDRVRAVYGDDCEIGHDGDLEEGGDRTLVWSDEDTAHNDDGSRAVAKITRWES